MKGYTGQILHVDLSAGTTEVEKPDESFYRRYVGGSSIVAYYLLKKMKPGTDAMDPGNVLVFATGPLTGAAVAGSGRNAVGAKSPLTGAYGEADVGGFFGAEMKRAGFDAVVVTGASAQPVYLWLHNGEATIRPADTLWGKTTNECLETIRSETGEKNARAAMIGPAGEKLVRYACIINDLKHAAGRTGLGAVMGAKKLKCVAARGRSRPKYADSATVKELGQYMRDNWREGAEGLYELGTSGGLVSLSESGALPTRNFQDGQFEGAEKIGGEAMKDSILVARESCYGCPVRCKRVVSVKKGEFPVDRIYGGPEYETMAAFGSNCGVDNLAAVSKANEYCNAYGLDTIAGGMVVSFAMECFENGLLTKKDTDGLDLSFGNAQSMVELTRQICTREGLGDLLADGLAEAARKIGPGAEKYAMTVKNQPFPMHECRTRHGQGLGYAVSPTGADHCHNMWDDGLAKEDLADTFTELGLYDPVPTTNLDPAKVRAYKFMSNWQWVVNQLGMCMFIPWKREQIVKIVGAVTGWHTNLFDLMMSGERGVTMARAFNMREGLTRADDILPERMSEHHKSKTLNEKPITPEQLQQALTTFYGMMGWDPDTGEPTRVRLQELDVGWIAE